ncbi:MULTISPECIES: PfkB family carbohydrate kinase [Micromonospora]|uniref:PfkB family carbohydrate kinase n=1 Tax=Micromonospora TaxID=1873 RepID=UPI000C88A2EF|nr:MULTISPECIES: PfkB family carbohydrate kinase [Micromonospora]PMR62715.1 hypothetical protein C1A38_02565 [Verrucosispora sp. ts21]WSK45559.1 PfkB family carbohydrate kinase [Micromonospora maris]
MLQTTTDDPVNAATALQRLSPRTVIVTAGQHGAAYSHPDGAATVPAPTVHAIDTTGAGDTFLGSLALDLARNIALPDAITTAVQTSSHTVQHVGAHTPAHRT